MTDDTTKKVIFEEETTCSDKPSWLFRTFGKMNKDSLRNTIFLMIAGTLGAGVYTLHQLFEEIGIIWSILLLVFACASSLLALDMYIHASKTTGDPETVADINTQILGKYFNYFSIAISAFFLFCILIAYTVGISNIIFEVVKERLIKYFGTTEEKISFKYHVPTCYIISLLTFFLVALKSIDKLSVFSIYCFMIHFYIIMVLVTQTYAYITYEEPAFETKDSVKINVYDFDLKGFFYNFGLAICAFNNVPNFLSARNLLKNPSTERLRKVFGRANWIIMVIYAITAICGYITVCYAGAKNKDFMIFRPKFGETDYLMTIGQCLLALSLMVTYSMLGFTLKMIILPYLPGKDTVKHYGLAAAICLSVAMIAMCYRSVGDFMNLAGSFCGTFIVILFPGFLALYSGYSKNKFVRTGIQGWMIIGGISGAISTYYAFMNLVKDKVVPGVESP